MDRSPNGQRRVWFCFAAVLYLLYAAVVLIEVLLKIRADDMRGENPYYHADPYLPFFCIAASAAVFGAVCFIRKRTVLHVIASYLFACAMVTPLLYCKSTVFINKTETVLLISDVLLTVSAVLTVILTGVSYYSHGRVRLFRKIWFVPGVFGVISAILLTGVNLQFKRAIVLAFTPVLYLNSAEMLAFLLESFDFLLLVPAIFLSCKWLSSLHVNAPKRETAEGAVETEPALARREDGKDPQDALAALPEEPTPDGIENAR